MTTMSHDEAYGDALAGYAIDALDANERRAFEAHLATCADCQAELIELRRTVAAVGGAVDPISPPRGLKARVIATATAQPQAPLAPDADAPAPFRRRPQPPATSAPSQLPVAEGFAERRGSVLPLAASLLIAGGLGIYAWSLRTEVLSLRQQVTQASARAEQLRDELTAVRRDAARFTHTSGILASPVLMKVELKGDPKAMPAAVGRAFMNRERGLFFHAEHLRALPDNQFYKLWVLSNGNAIASEAFKPATDGSASVNAPMPAGADAPAGVALTIETDPQTLKATTPIVMSGTQ